jgi:6-phosphofructokinase 1
MNACIRAIVRIGCGRGFGVTGVYGGFEGILNEDFVDLNARSVANIIHRGGTILTTGRSEEFKTEEGLKKAARNLDKAGFDALIAIGGDGTMRGLAALGKFWPHQTLGIPGTIDNDVYGTDFTIGFDTAVNNALEAIDKIRDTADSFSRVFLIEVMGRNSGAIAAHVGIASGATAIALPETKTDLNAVAKKLIEARVRGKSSSIIVVSEGDDEGPAAAMGEKLSKLINERCRVSVLGYIQRGGNPTRQDRILATRLGAFAIECLLKGIKGVMLGEVGGKLTTTAFEQTWSKKKLLDQYLLDRIDDLAA